MEERGISELQCVSCYFDKTLIFWAPIELKITLKNLKYLKNLYLKTLAFVCRNTMQFCHIINLFL